MKKLIAILLVAVFVLSIAACGKKTDTEATLPVSGGATEPVSTEGSTPADDAAVTEATETSTAADDETTAPSETTGNEIKPVETEPVQPDEKEDEDIKVEIGGEDITITPPDEESNDNFVIDFDDLMAATGN